MCRFLLPFLVTGALFAADPTAAIEVLQRHCWQCHGEAAAMSGLQLTTREAILKGGTRGSAASPGSASKSLLLRAIADKGKLAMPPGRPLAAEDIKIIREWIDGGMSWPFSSDAPKAASTRWWAFEKISHKPSVSQSSAHPIDAFLTIKMRAANVEPAPAADRLILLRRATFDLLGLAPSVEEIDAFLADKESGAWERVIDRLLASPRYGEKWGRHWLDLARYGDTAGFEQDPFILEAWRYRDYVIKSFNDDKPYDKFVKEQIAGDELYPDDPEARTGTGFYRVGTNRDMLFKVEDLNRVERLTDAVDTTSTVFLGMTAGCARCHDHKFDPIPQRDFYRMEAIFAPAVNDRAFLEYNMARFYDIAANNRDFRLRQIGAQISQILEPYRKELRDRKIDRLGEPARSALKVKAEERTPEQQTLAAQFADSIRVKSDEVQAALSPADAERIQAISRRLIGIFDNYSAPPTAPAITDVGRESPRTFIALRGNPEAPGEEVRPGFFSALGGGEIADPPLHARSTGRRKALAEWTASASNPLFSRVMVNRIWQYHFGSGLVKTASDFGTRAGQPSHPELLDWLASEFAERKWSIKAMHKLVLTSAAYQRSANPSASARAIDPANNLLSHMNRRRLQSEEIRDASLQASGELNLKAGGAPIVPPLAEEEMFGMIGNPDNAWPVTPDAQEHNRRSVYIIVRRTFQQPMFEAFDTPDGVLTCSRRNESTTAPQSLALLNSRFMNARARAAAEKASTVDEAWRRIFGRSPSAEEKALADASLNKQTALLGSRQAAMTELIRSLLNTNEFLYVD